MFGTDMTKGDWHWLFQCVSFAEVNSFPQNFLMFLLYAGYNFQCDMKQLTSSYETLGCLNHFEMLLDIQNVFKESSGGLSGLAEVKRTCISYLVLLSCLLTGVKREEHDFFLLRTHVGILMHAFEITFSSEVISFTFISWL